MRPSSGSIVLTRSVPAFDAEDEKALARISLALVLPDFPSRQSHCVGLRLRGVSGGFPSSSSEGCGYV